MRMSYHLSVLHTGNTALAPLSVREPARSLPCNTREISRVTLSQLLLLKHKQNV